MGTCEKPMTLKTLEWWVILLKDFEDEYDLSDMMNLTKTDGWVRMRYHSNFWVPPQYLIMGRA